ncbi:MAG: hypothetical protein ABSG87_09525, partial [Verrucomicrobiota bacterium]
MIHPYGQGDLFLWASALFLAGKYHDPYGQGDLSLRARCLILAGNLLDPCGQGMNTLGQGTRPLKAHNPGFIGFFKEMR